MSARWVGAFVIAVTTAAAFACNSGSSSNGGGDGGSSSGGNGQVTFSCTQDGIQCIQALAYPSEIAAEQSACAKSYGTFANGPCPAADYAGCCDKPSASEISCYFPQPGSPDYAQQCANLGGTWDPADGSAPGDDGGAADGATSAEAFVGTWLRSGSQTVTCPTGNPNTTNLAGDVAIVLGATSDSIFVTPPDGCQTTYSVSGNVATAAAGQVCSTTTEAGVAETITVVSHTLTLSADGQTIASTASATLDKTASGTMCTLTSSGTFTKQ